MSDLLASSWAKFHWAHKHLDAFQGAVSRSFDPNTHAVSIDVDVEISGDTAVAIAKTTSVPIVREDCGLALGDVVQNFRAALDHLAWDLVKAGADPRPRRPQDVYFPVAKSFASWRGSVDRKLPGVPGPQRAIIRRYQPYRRGVAARGIRRLRDLSDRDKHRVMVPVAMNFSPHLNASVESNWTVAGLRYLVTRPSRLKVNTPLVRIDLARPPGGAQDCHVQVNGEFSVYPALPGGYPTTALGEIRDTVLEILTEFDRLL
jgi:hypothetical protein